MMEIGPGTRWDRGEMAPEEYRADLKERIRSGRLPIFLLAELYGHSLEGDDEAAPVLRDAAEWAHGEMKRRLEAPRG